MKLPGILLLLAMTILLPACKDNNDPGHAGTDGGGGVPVDTTPKGPAPKPALKYGYRVVRTMPHDVGAFTQGLVYRDGIFYESTGLEGESSLRKVDVQTGKVMEKVEVPRPYFAEGMTVLGDRIYQITWRSQTCFVYDAKTLKKTGQFYYDGEGWGLTDDGSTLIMSDGTSRIRFIDPATFAVRSSINVSDNGRPVESINELEFIEGEIWANIWQTDSIARIDPATGRVTGWVDLSGILPLPTRTADRDVLNGIAYDPSTKKIYVTGKLWPSLFEIEVIAQGV